MVNDSTHPQMIALWPEDIQEIVAGLAANSNTMATMAQLMLQSTPHTRHQVDASAGPSSCSLSKQHLTVSSSCSLQLQLLASQINQFLVASPVPQGNKVNSNNTNWHNADSAISRAGDLDYSIIT